MSAQIRAWMYDHGGLELFIGGSRYHGYEVLKEDSLWPQLRWQSLMPSGKEKGGNNDPVGEGSESDGKPRAEFIIDDEMGIRQITLRWFWHYRARPMVPAGYYFGLVIEACRNRGQVVDMFL